MYADKITDSMRLTIDETERRRKKQMDYNDRNGLVPTPIVKNNGPSDLLELYEQEDQSANMKTSKQSNVRNSVKPRPYIEEHHKARLAAEPVMDYMSVEELERRVKQLTLDMRTAAANTDFIQAAQYRDELIDCQNRLDAIKKKRDDQNN